MTSYLVIGTSGGIGQLDGLDPATEDPRFPDTGRRRRRHGRLSRSNPPGASPTRPRRIITAIRRWFGYPNNRFGALADAQSWETFVGRHEVIGSQIIERVGLDPGELVQLRTNDHLVEVVAGADGRALVPAVLGYGSTRDALAEDKADLERGDYRLR